MKKDSKLEHLIDYVKMGWKILPVYGAEIDLCLCGNPDCGHPGKHPMTPNGFKNASTEIEQIQKWHNEYPRANWAVATGAESDVVVLDVDPDKDGEKTINNFPIHDTPCSKTGGGGIHYYFSYPGHKIDTTVERIGKGVDVRADGGYAILPPSKHISGIKYSWQIKPNDMDLAPTPDWLIKRNKKVKVKLTDKSDSEKIPDGRRNETMTSIAGTLKNRGLSTEAIRNALIGINEVECDPPLPEGDIQAMVKSSTKWKVFSSGKEYPYTDTGNAERFRDLFGNKLKYVSGWGWLYFNGRYWEKENSIVSRYAILTIRRIRSEINSTVNEDLKQRIIRWSFSSESDSKIKAMLSRAQNDSVFLADPDSFDSKPLLLNCRNGTIDLDSGALQPHDPNDLITKIVQCDYSADTECPLWLEFLNRVLDGNQELIDFIQKAIGYSLTGDTREQVLFILYGPGANGKTTFLETIRSLLNDYAGQADFNTFLVSNNDQIRNDLARLAGVRFVVAPEVEKGRRLAEAFVKQVTGGDKVTARFLRKEFFEYYPQFKIFMGTNYEPRISGRDDAIWRRIIEIPFSVKIPDEEQDKQLLEKLKAEHEGILAWAVQGCLKWQEEGLGIPPVVEEAVKEYRSEMDVIGNFITDCCTVSESYTELFSKLYSEYIDWCKQNNEAFINRKAFGIDLSSRGYSSGRINVGAIRKGIRLNKPGEESAVPIK